MGVRVAGFRRPRGGEHYLPAMLSGTRTLLSAYPYLNHSGASPLDDWNSVGDERLILEEIPGGPTMHDLRHLR